LHENVIPDSGTQTKGGVEATAISTCPLRTAVPRNAKLGPILECRIVNWYVAIERAFATYMRIHDIGYREAFELAGLLDCEIIQTAVRSLRGARSEPNAALIEQLTNCQTAYTCIQFEANRFRQMGARWMHGQRSEPD
jgi:hypothetical protein